jgi:membrane-bound metal-dependent hydrolase YbcI (DUF457 family)
VTAPSHLVIAIGSAVACSRFAAVVPTPTEFLILMCAALAPDIDGGGAITRPGTILRRFFPWRFVKVLDSFGLAVGALAQSISGHRGFFHWPIWGLLMMAIGVSFAVNWLFWFGLGYLSHIIADAMTKGGVPLFAPIRLKRVSLLSMRSGSWYEGVFSFIIFVLTVFYGWQYMPQGIQETFDRIKGLVSG